MITARSDLDASKEDLSLPPDKSGGDVEEVLVTVSFSVSRQEPWQAKLPADTHLSVVRESAMKFFGVVDHVDSAGNGIRHQLVRRGSTIEDLEATLAKFADDKGTLELRLVKVHVAG